MSAYALACEACAVWRYDVNKGVKLTYKSTHMFKAHSCLSLQSCHPMFQCAMLCCEQVGEFVTPPRSPGLRICERVSLLSVMPTGHAFSAFCIAKTCCQGVVCPPSAQCIGEIAVLRLRAYLIGVTGNWLIASKGSQQTSRFAYIHVHHHVLLRVYILGFPAFSN